MNDVTIRNYVHLSVGLFVWLATLIVYSLTRAPTLSFWDCGEFIAASYVLGIPHPPGTPLYILIGRVFSILPLSTDIAVRVNYLSVVSSSFTALFGYLAAGRILRGWLGTDRTVFGQILVSAGAAAAAFFLAFGVTNWNNSVEAEVYGLAMALMTLIFWLTLHYIEKAGTPAAQRLMLLIVYLGLLGIGVHMTVYVAVLVAALAFVLKQPGDKRSWFITTVFIAFELYLIFALSSRSGEIPYDIPVAIALLAYLFYIFSFERVPGCQLVVALGLAVAALPLLLRIIGVVTPGSRSGLSEGLSTTLASVGRVALVVIILWALYSLYQRYRQRTGSDRFILPLSSIGFVLAAGAMAVLLYVPKGYNSFLVLTGVAGVIYLMLLRRRIRWTVLVAIGGVSLIVLGVMEAFYGTLVAAGIVLLLGLVGKLSDWKTALMILLCAVAGYSAHLYLPIRSARQPALNENNPSASLAATINYIERKQYGSEAMVPRMFSRRAEWENQFGNHRRMGFWHFFHQQYGLSGPKFVVFFLAGVFGIWEVIRRRSEHGVPLLLLLLLCSIGLVLYMNFADGTRQVPGSSRDHLEVRDRDYFFTPAYVFFGLAVGIGIMISVQLLREAVAGFGSVPRYAIRASSLVLFLLPAVALARNYHRCDRTDNYIPYDYARNLLVSAPENAIIFTYGDNDTFPVWCLQEVYRVRPDVRSINLSLANGKWYIKQIQNNMNVNLGWTEEQIDGLAPFRTPDGALFRLQDLVTDAAIRNGRGRIPVCFATTVPPGVRTYRGRSADSLLVMDGLMWRVDDSGPPLRVDVESSYAFFTGPQGFQVRGLDDESIYKDNTTTRLTAGWATEFMVVADTLRSVGDYDRATYLMERAVHLIPHATNAREYLARLYSDQGQLEKLQQLIAGSTDAGHRLRVILGRTEINEKLYDRAERTLLSVLQEDPANHTALRELTRLYAETKQLLRLRSLLQRWLRTNPGDRRVERLLSEVEQVMTEQEPRTPGES